MLSGSVVYRQAMLNTSSPFAGAGIEKWRSITDGLIRQFPVPMRDVRAIVDRSWLSIFSSVIAGRFRIGTDIFPKPQIMGFLLHELIALEFQARHPNLFRPEASAEDKDVVCITNPRMSFEIKTSSNDTKVFGNRSYAQSGREGKKSKDGYYLTVNFPKVSRGSSRILSMVRFGWIDHADWIGQASQTGQQGRLTESVYQHKLVVI